MMISIFFAFSRLDGGSSEYVYNSNFDSDGLLLYGTIVRSGASNVRRLFTGLLLVVASASMVPTVDVPCTTSAAPCPTYAGLFW